MSERHLNYENTVALSRLRHLMVMRDQYSRGTAAGQPGL